MKVLVHTHQQSSGLVLVDCFMSRFKEENVCYLRLIPQFIATKITIIHLI
jgi:hypothetical protein